MLHAASKEFKTLVQIQVDWAKLYAESGRASLAYTIAKETLLLAQQYGLIEEALKATDLLIQNYQLQQEVDSILYYENIAKDLRLAQQTSNAVKNTTLAFMEAKLRAREKELFKERKQLISKMYLNFLIMGFLAIGLFFIVSYRLSRKVSFYKSEHEELNGHSREMKLQYEKVSKNLVQSSLKNIHEKKVFEEIFEKYQQKNGEGLSMDKNKMARIQDNLWKELEFHFTNLHSSFYHRIFELHPDLTENERRLIAFLKLDLSTKEISQISGQSIHAINMARIRLRKKLKLTHSNISFSQYFSKIMES